MDFGLSERIAAWLPDMVYTVPYFGDVDLAPLALAAILFLGLTAFFKVLQLVVLARLEALSKYTSTDVDDVLIAAVRGIRTWVFTLIALYIALQPFTLPEWLNTGVTAIVLAAIVWQAIEIAVKVIEYGVQRFVEKDEDGDGVVDPNAATASDMIKLIARIVLWALGGLFVLSNLGIEVTSLIAGLGIGGIAIAFALQGILSDLFASFSIYFDKPFRVGDYIVLGADSGTVEKIGIKSTRLRTLQGEELVVSNAELTTARVNNFKKLEERRIVMNFGITYETPYEKVQAVIKMVENIFTATEKARLDRVHFTTFGDSALIYEVVYYVESAAYAEYLDIQQQVNFEMMEQFAKEGIEFAYPTQTLFIKKDS
ncbi:mechanosensitive ion channel family protein [Candidatus Pacebacteria bacterium]|nr:mechanosensitive ion channel family protein [Candidatus Paceibacterota bacterium]